MCAVSMAQLGVKSKWADLVSLFPIVMFTAGAFRRWPVWVDGVVSGAVLVLGRKLHSGNVMLAGFLVARLSLELVPLLLLLRWREGPGAPASVTSELPAPSGAAG
jgi:hypothetical protein